MNDKTLGRYQILQEIGRGAMGTVYRARDPLIEREVAIKTLNASLPEEVMQEVRERFLREARSAGRLNHPNIVTIFDVGEQDGEAYIAMEFLEGRSLQRMMRTERLSVRAIADLTVQIAEGLDHAREFSIVHRDVKPANIVVSSTGRAKLTDFGVAYVPSSAMTQTGAALGSPKYMSPEQVLGQPIDPRADIFCLGVVLYEMLTGTTPFERPGETTMFGLMNRIAGEAHRPASELNADVPPAFERILAKALAKRPEDRYQRAGEMAADLRAFLSGSEPARAAVDDDSYAKTMLAGEMAKLEDAAGASGPQDDMGALLEQRERLEKLVQEKFKRRLTVMFTDLKGSTAIAETYGDLESRAMIKRYHDLAAEAIKANGGVLVKTIGDGTLSHFESALSALRAAATIQRSMDEFNLSGKFKTPVLVRVGMHTGECFLEKNDIFGDVVNTASRFESSANAGEILISEETFHSLEDKAEIYCRFRDEIMLKGKKEPFRAYKAFWDPKEVEKDKLPGTPLPLPPAAVQATPAWKLTVMIALPVLAVLAITVYITVRDKPDSGAHRSIIQSVPGK
jgi:class 3 adenylate cyclase